MISKIIYLLYLILCIYFKNYDCWCDRIDLDNAGVCTTCVLIDFDDEQLNLKRDEQLEKFEHI